MTLHILATFIFYHSMKSYYMYGFFFMPSAQNKGMKKTLLLAAMITILATGTASTASAQHCNVQRGDSMWKIAVKYEVGLSEIKSANPQIVNPELIYPGQIINIPTVDSNVRAFESEVIRLVNEIRVQNGLNRLTEDWELSRVARYKSQDMKDNNYFSHTYLNIHVCFAPYVC